jgi:PRC-barrel domain protein
MATIELWTFHAPTAIGMDLSGFTVEAIDGKIGKVDETTQQAGGSYIVVDTGPWIFGKKVLVPAGVVSDVDLDGETVFVRRTKDEIKNAPEFDEERYRDEAYRREIGGYYGPGGQGYRDPSVQ